MRIDHYVSGHGGERPSPCEIVSVHVDYSYELLMKIILIKRSYLIIIPTPRDTYRNREINNNTEIIPEPSLTSSLNLMKHTLDLLLAAMVSVLCSCKVAEDPCCFIFTVGCVFR